MSEEKLNNLIKNIKNDKMTSFENAVVKHKVMSFINKDYLNEEKLKTKISPYYSFFSLSHMAKLVGVSMLIVILGIGGISGASASALPGDTLYPVKTNIKEKVEEVIAFTPEAKIAYRKRIIETRLQETEQLIALNRLTPENQHEIDLNIHDQTIQIKDHIEKIRKIKPEQAISTEQEINNSINIHRDRIDKMLENKILKEDAKLQKLEEKNIKIEIKKDEIKTIKEKVKPENSLDHSSNNSNSSSLDLVKPDDLLRKNQTDKIDKEINKIQKRVPKIL